MNESLTKKSSGWLTAPADFVVEAVEKVLET
jgi:hypothetical protein